MRTVQLQKQLVKRVVTCGEFLSRKTTEEQEVGVPERVWESLLCCINICVQQVQVPQVQQVQVPQVQQVQVPQVQQQVQVQQVQIQQQVQSQVPHFHTQSQQQQIHHHRRQQQQAQTYYNNVAIPIRPNQDNVENNVPEQHAQHISYQTAKQQPARYINRLPQMLEHQQPQQPQQQQQSQQPQQQQVHMLNQVQRITNNVVTLMDGRKQMSVEEWHRLQQESQQQQQPQMVAAAPKRPDRSGVITMTRQNIEVGSQVMASVMQQQRPQLRHENSSRRSRGKFQVTTPNNLVTKNTVEAIASPNVDHQHTLLQENPPLQYREFPARRSYGKSRARTQNTLVTNNTVQAIASPTVKHHHNLLQQQE
ncbi:hypothetical protein C0J52_00231 [Blattella germanica]|nr:hypothetical protein C0J52_00231 [Blattella germanica]